MENGTENHRERVQDPLKPLEQVMESDPRFQGSQFAMQQQHAELSQIQLIECVPLDVRQLFETAKNVSLYSWFVYRFHQVAELVAYTALERALKDRIAHEQGVNADNIRGNLSSLLKRAARNNWLKSEKFTATKYFARRQLEQEQFMQMIQENRFGDEPIEVPDIPEAKIDARAAKLNFVEILATGIPHLRNHLAHGGPLLHPDSASTLRVVAEAINQLFETSGTTAR
jgi:hypothetical protein